MGLAQLYYTSCETGLSGFAGFQFNAVTPGIPPDVLRTVESLTSYKPPRWLGARPTPEERRVPGQPRVHQPTDDDPGEGGLPGHGLLPAIG
jgi:hypothetical protein